MSTCFHNIGRARTEQRAFGTQSDVSYWDVVPATPRVGDIDGDTRLDTFRQGLIVMFTAGFPMLRT